MRRYEKPVMQVERYAALNSVADGCNRVQTGVNSATGITANQTVTCIVTTSAEGVFNANAVNASGVVTGCTNNVSNVVYVPSDVTLNGDATAGVNYLAGNYSGGGNSHSSYTLKAGYYLVYKLSGDSRYHAGPISSTLYDQITMGYSY